MESSNQTTPIVLATVAVPKIISLFKNGWQFLKTRIDLVKWYLVSVVVMSFLSAEITYGLLPNTLAIDVLFNLLFVGTIIAMVINSWILMYAVAQPEVETVTFTIAAGWVRKHVWALLWTTIVSAVFLFFGFLLFLIPGIVFSCYWYFAHYAQMTGAGAGTKALKASYRLVKGRWWQTFYKLCVATVYLIIGYVAFMMIYVLGLVLFGDGGWGLFVADVVSQALSSAILGVITIYIFGQYFKYLAATAAPAKA